MKVFMLCVCMFGIVYSQGTGMDPDAMSYLETYQYTGTGSIMGGAITDYSGFRRALMMFQDFAGLEQTGEYDEPTKTMMALPRCGVWDVKGMGDIAKREKRYTLQGSKWPRKNLRYSITKYPADNDLSVAAVDEEIARAFDVWASVTPLTFQKVSGNSWADIKVSFEPRRHDDGNDFDGPGGTLAHAFFPQFGGDAHMDDEEKWSRKSYSGTNLFQVAAHEFGHSLGLSHSRVQSALMAPFYRGYVQNFQLDADDIDGIQQLYGKQMKMETTTPPRFTPPPTTPPTMKIEEHTSELQSHHDPVCRLLLEKKKKQQTKTKTQ